MNKFYDTLTNSRGDSLGNYRVQVVQPLSAGGGIVPIFADQGGTRFLDPLGIPVDYATADREGLVQFYWVAETGHILQVLDPAGGLEKTIPGFADNYSQEALTGIIQPILERIAPDIASASAAATALFIYTQGYIGINDPFPPAGVGEGEGYHYVIGGELYGALNVGGKPSNIYEIATAASLARVLAGALDRANQTGTQAIATVDGLQEALADKLNTSDFDAAQMPALSANGNATTLQRHIVRTYLEDVGVIEAGTAADNAAALSAAIAGGNVTLNARPGAQYSMGNVPIAASGVRIVCERSRRPVFYMPAATFTNTEAKSYGATATLFDVKGALSGGFAPVSNVLLENFVIQSELLDARYLRAISVRNANNVNINGVEIFGLPAGIGITLATVSGDSALRDCYIHDFYSNYAWATTNAQTTAIEIDNDRVNSTASQSIKIISPQIDNLVFGAAAIAAIGDQVDGINIQHWESLYHTITDARISRVNEAIDLFSSNCTINGGIYSDIRGFALKLVHGASYNTFNSPVIRNAVQGYFAIAGSPNATQNTQGNVVVGGTGTGLNYNQAAVGSQAGVFITNNGGEAGVGGRPRYNSIRGFLLDQGQYGRKGWLDESSLGDNYGEAIQIIPGAASEARIQITNGGGRVSLAGAAQTYYDTGLN